MIREQDEHSFPQQMKLRARATPGVASLHRTVSRGTPAPGGIGSAPGTASGSPVAAAAVFLDPDVRYFALFIVIQE